MALFVAKAAYVADWPCINTRQQPPICLSIQLQINQSSCTVVIITMAREEELKRVDLKMNVSCCEGCRRKVMKAMSLKGVLRTEIHPSLDKVTVVGDVDSRVLVRKLAKIGKIAEVVAPPSPQEEHKKREDNGRKDSDGSDKPAQEDEKRKRKDDGKDTGGKAAATSSKQECNKCTQQGSARADDTNHANGKAPSKDAAAAKSSDEGDGFVGANSSVPNNAATYHHHYHRAEPAVVVPVHMPYYAANATPYYGGYYTMPPPPPPTPMPQRPPQLRPQPSRFDEDFFNDDDTVGCRVM